MGRAPYRTSARVLIAAAFCAAGVAVLALLFYGSTRISTFDARVTSHFLADEGSGLERLGEFGAGLAGPVPLLLAVLGLIALGVAWNRPWHLVAGGGVILLANLTTQAMKLAMAHPRLPGALGVSYPIDVHYPSGHATAALSVGFGLWLVAPPRWKGLAAVVGCAYGAAVSVGVVVAGWHFISDVLGAVMVVGFWGLLALALLRSAGREATANGSATDR